MKLFEINQLSYSYSAQNQDQLLKVDDGRGYTGGFGFKDQVKESVEYEYDADGNLTKDKNKGYTYTYNELNKVSQVSSLERYSKEHNLYQRVPVNWSVSQGLLEHCLGLV